MFQRRLAFASVVVNPGTLGIIVGAGMEGGATYTETESVNAAINSAASSATYAAFGNLAARGMPWNAGVHHSSTEAGRDVALGLGYTATHNPTLVQRFAAKVGANSYVDWVRAGLASPNPSFPVRFLEATSNARTIHFNLSGMRGIEKGFRPMPLLEAVPNMEPGTMAVTEAELSYILQTPSLLDKTLFYYNGSNVPPPPILQ